MNFSQKIQKLKSMSGEFAIKAVWRLWVRFFNVTRIVIIILAIAFLTYVWIDRSHVDTVDGSTTEQEIQLRKDALRFRDENFNAVIDEIDRKGDRFESAPPRFSDIFFPEAASFSRNVDETEAGEESSDVGVSEEVAPSDNNPFSPGDL